MNTLKTKTLSWHHIKNPKKADIEWLKNHYNFHEIVLSELTRSTMRPKVESYDHYLYMVLHFPIFEESERKTYQREIDFLITKKDVITVSYDGIPPLDSFFKTCVDDLSCEELYASKTSAHLLFFIIQNLFEFSLRQLDHVQENINKIEDKIFSGSERNVVEELSIIRRDIIDFRRAIKPEHITLESLKEHGTTLFGKSLEPFFSGLIGEYMKVWNLLENNKEALDALYDNNTSLLNIRQNDIMKLFTILAFVTFPLSLFVSILGIDSPHNPIRGTTNDFWLIMGFVVVSITTMLAIFKRKKWL